MKAPHCVTSIRRRRWLLMNSHARVARPPTKRGFQSAGAMGLGCPSATPAGTAALALP
jgi:hypothetical protein